MRKPKSKYSAYLMKAISSYLSSGGKSKKHVEKHFKISSSTARKYVNYLYNKGRLKKKKSGYKREVLYKRK